MYLTTLILYLINSQCGSIINIQYTIQNYGIFMMREIEALFPEVKFFTLDTPAWNIRTNAFYTRLGYSEVKRDDEFIYYSKKR